MIRTIGDPAVRLREDPVRMLRAVALAARLDFTIDRDSVEAIRALRGEIVRSSPARILEEFYKILRQGAARRTFRLLHDLGLLAYLLPEADQAIVGRRTRPSSGASPASTSYRAAGLAAPEALTNALLMGTLLVPLGVPLRRVPVAAAAAAARPEEAAEAEPALDVAAEMAALGESEEPGEVEAPADPNAPLVMPFARRDLDRLAADPGRPAPAARGPPVARREAHPRRPRLPRRRAALARDPRRTRGPGAGRALARGWSAAPAADRRACGARRVVRRPRAPSRGDGPAAGAVVAAAPTAAPPAV